MSNDDWGPPREEEWFDLYPPLSLMVPVMIIVWLILLIRPVRNYIYWHAEGVSRAFQFFVPIGIAVFVLLICLFGFERDARSKLFGVIEAVISGGLTSYFFYTVFKGDGTFVISLYSRLTDWLEGVEPYWFRFVLIVPIFILVDLLAFWPLVLLEILFIIFSLITEGSSSTSLAAANNNLYASILLICFLGYLIAFAVLELSIRSVFYGTADGWAVLIGGIMCLPVLLLWVFVRNRL